MQVDGLFINSCTIGQGRSLLAARIMSRHPYVNSKEDLQEIMDFQRDLGGKFIMSGKCIERRLKVWFVCISEEFVGFLNV